MADKAELQHLPQGEAALVLSEARSSLIARARRDAGSLISLQSATPLHGADRTMETTVLVQDVDAEELLRLGRECLARMDYLQAGVLFRKAADHGLAEAQCELGVGYDIGHTVPRDDSMAASWLRKAADQGHIEAQYYLGVHYFNGDGVPQDDAEAALWFHKAADQGYSEALYFLRRLGVQEG